MLIQLHQPQIVEALKQYIASQGFNLTDKVVEIHFTAGRKNNGLSADLRIEDAPAQAPAPQLVVVAASPVIVGEPEATPETPKGTTSLFG